MDQHQQVHARLEGGGRSPGGGKRAGGGARKEGAGKWHRRHRAEGKGGKEARGETGGKGQGMGKETAGDRGGKGHGNGNEKECEKGGRDEGKGKDLDAGAMMKGAMARVGGAWKTEAKRRAKDTTCPESWGARAAAVRLRPGLAVHQYHHSINARTPPPPPLLPLQQ